MPAEALDRPVRGCQSIYAPDGSKLFSGGWDSRAIYDVLTGGDDAFWAGKTVLEIAGNTGGLAVEIARRGADVTLTEPDPYQNCYTVTGDIVQACVENEGLALRYHKLDFFGAIALGTFDVVICLGLIYHFKYPQLMIDHMAHASRQHIFVSTQTHPGDDLAMWNRQHPGVLPDRFLDPNGVLTGWHPTRKLFEAMITAAGCDEVTSLTEPHDLAPRGLTNSAYYRARVVDPKDPAVEQAVYYPR